MAESNQRCSCTYPNYNPFTDRCMICGGYYCKDLLTNPPPMTNDKLTDVIKNEINAEANKYSEIILNGRLLHVDDKLKGYIAGATVWAPWKVRFDELQAQAKSMADALEAFILWQGSTLKNWPVMKQAHEAIQQFKDGTKRQEVENG